MMTKSKPKPSSEWEARNLYDGRIGLFRNGLCVKVFQTIEELSKWLDLRRGDKIITPNNPLNHAIGRL